MLTKLKENCIKSFMFLIIKDYYYLLIYFWLKIAGISSRDFFYLTRDRTYLTEKDPVT
jgi:hypothetical protein